MSERLQSAVIVTVLVVWVANFAAGAVPWFDYDPAESINGIFGLVVSAVIAFGKKQRRGGDSDE